jgi:hypothetical protein
MFFGFSGLVNLSINIFNFVIEKSQVSVVATVASNLPGTPKEEKSDTQENEEHTLQSAGQHI